MIERYSKNVSGDFYTDGDCMACELPEEEAPKLLAQLINENYDTYFVKQPETEDELAQAISACQVCCVNALRYGGKDKEILIRLGEDYCDYKIDLLGNIVLNEIDESIQTKSWWKFW